MLYLHTNAILQTLMKENIHLDVFFKYLWRHIFILQLIKLRYPKQENPNWLTSLFPAGKAQHEALKYLKDHGDDFLSTADTHIKNLTQDFVQKLKVEGGISTDFSIPPLKGSGKLEGSYQKDTNTHVEYEVNKDKAQSIISNFQNPGLSKVIEELSAHIFQDKQKRFFLLIDDLDKNWMPDDELFLDLTKALLEVIKEINQRMSSVKILVAMRTNIYYRVTQKKQLRGPQREKWSDSIIQIKWSEREIIELIDKRLSRVFREEYTSNTPRLRDIMPKPKNIDFIDYLIERTFLRPRDVIDFVNKYLETMHRTIEVTTNKVYSAEATYSKSRLQSVCEEWKDSFDGIEIIIKGMKQLYPRFESKQLDDTLLNQLLSSDICKNHSWLLHLQEVFIKTDGHDIVRNKILSALYMIGFIGIRDSVSHKFIFSYLQSVDFLYNPEQDFDNKAIIIHKMFYQALGVSDTQSTS